MAIAGKLYKHGPDEMHLTASIGFAITPAGMNINSPAIESKELVRLADIALYDAKRAGRNCIRHREMPLGGDVKQIWDLRSKSGKKKVG